MDTAWMTSRLRRRALAAVKGVVGIDEIRDATGLSTSRVLRLMRALATETKIVQVEGNGPVDRTWKRVTA